MLEWLLCSDPLAALLELFFQPPDGIASTALGPLHPVKLLNRGLGHDGNETPAILQLPWAQLQGQIFHNLKVFWTF